MTESRVFDYDREQHQQIRSPRPVPVRDIGSVARWREITAAAEAVTELPLCRLCGERIPDDLVYGLSEGIVYHVGCFDRCAANLRGAVSR